MSDAIALGGGGGSSSVVGQRRFTRPSSQDVDLPSRRRLWRLSTKREDVARRNETVLLLPSRP